MRGVVGVAVLCGLLLVGCKTVDERRVDDSLDPRCPVHGEELKTDRLRIAYGLMLYPDGYRDSLREAAPAFPYANDRVTGGCMVDPNRKFARVHYCTQCRDAKEAWAEQWQVERPVH